MLKKILAATLAAMMLVAVATSCDREPEKGSSSKKPTSSVESIVENGDESDITSSGISEGEVAVVDPDANHGYDYTIKTKSSFFRDTEEAGQSVSRSETIKQYKSKGTYMIGCYQVRMGVMDHYGDDLLSRVQEFKDVVKQGYFNSFLLSYDQKYNQYEMPIIAESGGTFWLGMGRFSTAGLETEAEKKAKEDDYIAKVQEAIDFVDSLGCLDLLNGFYYDEPIWTGQSNEDFLTQTKIHYVNFGLRNFPVFATGEFTAEEGNAGGDIPNADEMRKLNPSSAKYLTDVSFDSYRIDVRPEATYPQATYDRWEKNTGNVHECSSGLDYYTAHRKWLIEYIGHPANFYHYPTAYHVKNIQGGLTSIADEAFCTGHLEGLAKDVLSDKAGGGLMLYTYPTNNLSSLNLSARLPIKDKNGYYTMFPEEEKWFTYDKALKNVKKKFDATKQTIQYKTKKSK